ncbi:CaiB/BaiF CoA transferase family protein [Sphingosinicella sp. LY1275]|uniref:CaiB/BaiF CoA transferase family protein n=1 Tax=Sphingosinicella sp. LY1275 TaxID=3095379 RepID=UPI002ADECDE9|nr:CoA transferase [Sphingosinicella sp. LY1275]MEA1015753.1 CoA transferase [Sphingosinicella sp. LY1275]
MTRVLDLTTQTGAYATKLLVEAGHDVVRIEAPEGDELRRRGPFLDGAPPLEAGADHHFLNAGKRSLTLDLEKEAGQQVFLALVASAELVVANLPLAVELERLFEARPDLIFIGIEGEGPELCTAARTGLISITGQPGQRPCVPGGHVSQAIVALHVAIAAAAALYAQEDHPQGQKIFVSEAETLISMMEQAMVTWTTTDRPTERKGYRGAVTAVSGAFECADGYWMLSVPPSGDGWSRFVEWMGDPALGQDGALDSEASRNAERDTILDVIDRWSLMRRKSDLVNEGQARHIPATPVNTPLELAADPQLIGRGFLRDIDHPLLGTMRMPIGAIAALRGTPPVHAPILGEHSREVLSELGYSDDVRRSLIETGII